MKQGYPFAFSAEPWLKHIRLGVLLQGQRCHIDQESNVCNGDQPVSALKYQCLGSGDALLFRLSIPPKGTLAWFIGFHYFLGNVPLSVEYEFYSNVV